MLTINRVCDMSGIARNITVAKAISIDHDRDHIDAQYVTEWSFYTEIITGHVNSLGAVWRHFYIYINIHIYIYPHGARDTALVIFGGKIRSCKLFSSQDLMSCDAWSLSLVDFWCTNIKTKQSVTCVQLYTVFYSVLHCIDTALKINV